ncbi:uncharacterized protein BDV14DRAFT_202406 [Aspergillus stella-maris]|uniref:uncharacterized protein n=1 Tax=Aspergillus stella-maris TaxID=1810926 RepID=UPI003CCCFB8F
MGVRSNQAAPSSPDEGRGLHQGNDEYHADSFLKQAAETGKYSFCGTTKDFCGDSKVTRPSCDIGSQSLTRDLGQKLWLSIGEWAFSDDGSPMAMMFSDVAAANDAHQEVFFVSLTLFMLTWGFNGVDIN